MLRQVLGLAGALLLVSPAVVNGQGVPRPGPSRVWSTPIQAATDTTHRKDHSVAATGAVFGGLMGVAFGIGWCSGDNQCSKGASALIGGALGAALGFGLGTLLGSL